jgi:hypothetical protein
MTKGQIFSIDLLFAAIIAILFVGVIVNSSEVINYQSKEEVNQNELLKYTKSSLIRLTNSEYSCIHEGDFLTNSINLTTLTNKDSEILGQELGLVDKNYVILINDSPVKNNGALNYPNIISYDLNILTCSSTINFSELNKCMRGDPCPYNETKITLKVSE